MITDGMSALNEMFDRMRERGHLFLALVDTDPNSAMQLLAEHGREVLSLPGDDQLELMEIFRAIFVKVEETTTQDELISALSGVGDTIRP
jgi:hypothetical protein